MNHTFRLFIASLAILVVCLSQASAQKCSQGPIANVMTRNLDAGSDYGYVIAVASDPNADEFDILMAITKTYREMIDSNIPARARIAANEIRSRQPDLIGLQEITTLRTGPYGQPAGTIVVDGLQSLVQALDRLGLHYKAIAVQTNASVDLPAFDENFNVITVGVTDYDAVLVRTDRPEAEFSVSEVQMQHFETYLPFTVGGQTIAFLRGWISAQVNMSGTAYKFVTTHLETFSPDIQAAQTNELLAGPLISELPVILAGDLNSDAYNPSWTNGPAFTMLTTAGFQDVWGKLRPDNPGLTWPLFAEDPPAPIAPWQRIDLILTRGNIKGKTMVRTGLSPARTGLWASDHTGVQGKLVILP